MPKEPAQDVSELPSPTRRTTRNVDADSAEEEKVRQLAPLHDEIEQTRLSLMRSDEKADNTLRNLDAIQANRAARAAAAASPASTVTGTEQNTASTYMLNPFILLNTLAEYVFGKPLVNTADHDDEAKSPEHKSAN